MYSHSRLWYTHYLIEKIVIENPQYNLTLDEVLKDISPPETRSQLFERTGTAKFSSLAAGIINARLQHEGSNKNKLEQDQNREFMKNISALGTGLPFDLMDSMEIDDLCDRALKEALNTYP